MFLQKEESGNAFQDELQRILNKYLHEINPEDLLMQEKAISKKVIISVTSYENELTHPINPGNFLFDILNFKYLRG